MGVSYRNNDGEIVEDPFSFLDITTESEVFSVGFRQPIIQENDQEFALSFSLDRINGETVSGEEPSFNQLFIDGSENGEWTISALRFSQNWLKRSSNSIFAINSNFSFGLNLFDATVNENAPDGQFVSWNGELQWLEALNDRKNAVLETRIRYQLSSDRLLPTEQFNNTVRGYRQNIRVADNGIVGSIGLFLPLVDNSSIGLIQLASFVDLGTVWNVRGEVEGSNTLASVGLGLRWRIENVLSARIEYGIPLIEVDNQGDSLQADGWLFSVNFVPLQF